MSGSGEPSWSRVILKRGRSKPLWLGHPWVYSRAIERVVGPARQHGGPCLLEDERGNVVGAGHYHPEATIAVRLLEHRRSSELPFEPRPPLQVVEQRLQEALGARTYLGLPAPDTDAYRVVNAEGDRLPGLVVERFATAAVVQLNSRAMYQLREPVARRVMRLLGADRVALMTGGDAARLEGLPAHAETWDARGELVEPEPVELRENGVRYRVVPGAGQKTGFYFDQRDNRRRLAGHCPEKSVLDLYSHVGGFGLNAALAGARRVECVETSPRAVEAAVANARLNGLSEVEVHRADAIAFLKDAEARGRTWDRIVCDPPKLVRKRSHLDEALDKYVRLNTLALSRLAEGGLLLSCTCSQHVSSDAFLRVLTEAAHRLRRPLRVHALWGQAPDHPWLSVAPEGSYLHAALVSCPG